MSRQRAVLTGVSGADTVIAGRMPSALTARFDLSTTANTPGSGNDRGYSIAVRVTRALFDI
jgi:hypothetical protein